MDVASAVPPSRANRQSPGLPATAVLVPAFWAPQRPGDGLSHSWLWALPPPPGVPASVLGSNGLPRLLPPWPPMALPATSTHDAAPDDSEIADAASPPRPP